MVSDGQVTHKVFVGYNLNYSTLDDQKHPTTGIYAVFSQQYDAWDFNYIKSELKARYFMPLGDTGVIASVKGQAGIINHLGGGSQVPAQPKPSRKAHSWFVASKVAVALVRV